ncbi:MAG: hypothetical protein P8I98_09235 [Nitrospinaceae bacterium]|nr:hypothetical protein [Nitrospinaceae bacterium]
METILVNIIEVLEPVWFKLVDLLSLKEMKTLDSIQPILAKILSDPLLLGLTLALIGVVPYTIIKLKKSYTLKENRLDALLSELTEEDNEEVSTNQPLPQNQSTKNSNLDQPTNESDTKAYGNEFELPSLQKKTITSGDLNQTPQEIFKNRRISNDDFGWETDVEEWDELYDYISKPFQVDKPKQENESATIPQESQKTGPLTQENLNQTPQEIFKNRRISDDDFGWETDVEEWDELYDYISKPFQTDKPKDVASENEVLQEVEKEVLTEVAQKEETVPSTNQATEITTESSLGIGIDELAEQIIEETMLKEESTEEPSNINIDQLTELIEDEEIFITVDQKNKIITPKEEVRVEVNQLNESITEQSSNIDIDELAELIREEESVPGEKPLTTNTLSTSETKHLEPNEAVSSTSEPQFSTSSPVPQRVELTLEDVVKTDLEPKPALQSKTSNNFSETIKESPSTRPLLNSILNSSVSAQTDALVSRLKTFQSELEVRFQSLEQESETRVEAAPTETLRKKQGSYQPANVSYKSKQKSRSNKEYLRQLESFIFMARQKSKNTKL